MTDLQYRSFRTVKTSAIQKKATIKPYDNSQLGQKFRDQYMQRITKLEEEISAARDEYYRMIEVMEAEKAEIDERKIRIDDRTIGLVSFSATIQFYSRFLDTRESYANDLLTDRIDELDVLDKLVSQLEQSVADMEAAAQDDDMTEIQEMLTEEEFRLCQLENSNEVKRQSVRVRQQLLPAKRKIIPTAPNLTIQKVPHNSIFGDTIDIQSVQDRMLNGSYQKLKRKQEELHEIEVQLQLLEEHRNGSFVGNTNEWKKKAEHINKLKAEFNTRTALTIEIEEANKANDRLKQSMFIGEDNDCEARRELAFERSIEDRIDLLKQEIECAENRIKEARALARKKEKLFAKKRARNDSLQEEVNALEKAADAKEMEIVMTEKAVFDTELRMNMQLKDEYAASGYVVPAEAYQSETGGSLRMEEMQKIFELVSVDKEI